LVNYSIDKYKEPTLTEQGIRLPNFGLWYETQVDTYGGLLKDQAFGVIHEGQKKTGHFAQNT
jgi:hypothetical protein